MKNIKNLISKSKFMYKTKLLVEIRIWFQNSNFIGKPKFRIRISSTFSALRPFSYLRPFLYFDLSTSSALLRLFVKSGFLIGREAQVEVKFGRSKVGGSKYRKGQIYENGQSTEKFELMRTQNFG